MRRALWAIALLVAGTLATNSTAIGDIRNTHHDFGGATWTGNQICVPCHTPHNANLSVTAAPLWNHAITTATYTVYTSPTLNAIMTQPAGLSKLCLSCHDGTVAIDSFGGLTGTRTMPFRGNFGTNLRKHHPVSFPYDSALAAADGELHDPSTRITALGGTINQDLLFAGRLECASCHDVHVSRGSGNCTDCHNSHFGTILAEGSTKSLRIDNQNSAFCLTCHVK